MIEVSLFGIVLGLINSYYFGWIIRNLFIYNTDVVISWTFD
uniref:Uncharacterized protein n=1 Tax=Brassica campestris TaxID=3711 RepID=A0A3P6DE13_BRACM|nr:unnamed protein product [Brassica rapa]